MIAPATAARWLLSSLAIGAALGLCYGFLRPLRPKHTAVADLIFVIAAFWGWIYIGFGVCGGDLRFGCSAAMAAGGFLWELTAGRLLRPVFRRFWRILSKIWGFFLWPAKKFLEKSQKIVIFLLASLKKWFTIGENRHSIQPKFGGNSHGKKKSRHQAGLPQVQPHNKSSASGSSGAVHHRASDPARLHRGKPESV